MFPPDRMTKIVVLPTAAMADILKTFDIFRFSSTGAGSVIKLNDNNAVSDSITFHVRQSEHTHKQWCECVCAG